MLGTLSRRTALKTLGATSLPLGAIGALAASEQRLLIYDSALGVTTPFADVDARLDLVHERRRLWRSVRSGLAGVTCIEGMTRWSDWVALSSELTRHGFRTRREHAAGSTVRWTLIRRSRALTATA